MLQTKFRTAYILSFIIVILATIASAGGLFIETLYRDNTLIKSAWHGNDAATLVIAIPMMIISLIFTIRGSKRAQLVWIGTLGYMLYNYMFYLYGAAFNYFFLIYVTIFTLSIYALILSLINIDVLDLGNRFSKRTPARFISGYMFFFGGLLGLMWVALSLSFVVSGKIPQAITQTDHPTGVIFATDLSLLIPSLILSAILLWKRLSWGYVLSTIVMTKASTYGLAMIAMSIFAYAESGIVDAMLPLWIILSLGCIISFAFLLFNISSGSKRLFQIKNKINI